MDTIQLAMREYAIIRAIDELQSDNDVITYDQIAEHIGAHRNTVLRSIQWLKDNSVITIVDGSNRAGGYRYKYNGA